MNDEHILNSGLELALEFGANWLQPIQSRLARKFPELKSDALDKYNATCSAAMKQGHEYVYKTLETATNEKKELKQNEIAEGLKSFLHAEYPWINAENLNSILSQGFYYAWKDGLYG